MPYNLYVEERQWYINAKTIVVYSSWLNKTFSENELVDVFRTSIFDGIGVVSPTTGTLKHFKFRVSDKLRRYEFNNIEFNIRLCLWFPYKIIKLLNKIS